MKALHPNMSVAESSFLIDKPRTYRYWWTLVPVLPRSREDHGYAVLKRQWADHTMNTIRREGDAWRVGSRGAYVEGREDHITPALFQIWAAFPGASWAARLLSLWGIVPEGDVTAVRWSYSWEQKRALGMRPDITDIVVQWRDRGGFGALVIEAKRRGGAFGPKDIAGGTSYLMMPSLQSVPRRAVGFLVDERDLATATTKLPKGTRIATWQDMGKAQSLCASEQQIPDADRRRMQALIASHFAHHGMGFDQTLSGSLGNESFDGSEKRYAAVRAQALPAQIEAFFLGSEVSLCARRGLMPAPPFAWLAEEPSLLDLTRSPQPTSDRERPLWRIPDLQTDQQGVDRN